MANTISRRRPLARRWLAGLMLVLAAAVSPAAAEDDWPMPGPTDKCPICGMFVHRHPDFLASATFDDGQTLFFDGVKDLFKYLFRPDADNPDRRRAAIARIRVTEYYDMRAMDARAAVYVIGSDVFGPMGKELIPFRAMADAQLFSKDHHGRRIFSFDQITPDVIAQLD